LAGGPFIASKTPFLSQFGPVVQFPHPFHVFPRISLVVGISQQSRRVIGYDQWNAVVLMQLSTQLRQGGLGLQQGVCRLPTEATDDLWGNQLDLSLQVRLTAINLLRLWISIVRRTTLENVTNIDLLSGKLHGTENLRQQFPGCTNEWLPPLVLLLSRCLAHKQNVGVRIA
jgi:hypothetical protein